MIIQVSGCLSIDKAFEFMAKRWVLKLGTSKATGVADSERTSWIV